jgi:phosphoribosylformylglycinamidine (FGAM) synthase-like enzyme
MSAKPVHADKVLRLATRYNVPAAVIGSVNTSGELRIGDELQIMIREAEDIYCRAIPKAMGEE